MRGRHCHCHGAGVAGVAGAAGAVFSYTGYVFMLLWQFY